jgi:hypothetical protein
VTGVASESDNQIELCEAVHDEAVHDEAVHF